MPATNERSDTEDLSALYRAIVESTDAAVISKLLDGTILSWNGAAERIFGYPAEEMVGQSIRRLIPADRQDEEDRIIAQISRGERVTSFETLRLRKDGSTVPISVIVSPVRNDAGEVIAASKIARDITHELALRTSLRETEGRFRLMADNISQLAWIAGPDGALTWYNQRWYDFTGTTFEQMQGWGWQKVQHPDRVQRVTEHYKRCVESGEEWEDTFPLRSAQGEYRWFLSRAVPLRDEEGEIRCWFGTNTDITERRDAERQIALLLREVNHRSKNMLAVIQSLASRTAASGGDFIRRLEQRIAGLSANQDLLVSRNWHSVPLAELVDAQLQFLSDVRDHVEVTGPDVSIQPAAAESIAMAIHEMATNAEKYGALSVPEGRVRVDWEIVQDDAGPMLRMRWVEHGGPPVVQPERTGFGSQIIDAVPRARLRGTIETRFDPEGFRWMLTCPVENALV